MARIDHELLNRVIRENIEALCRHFFANGQKVNEEWKVGNLQGDKGRTLNINLSRDKAGLFQDFATGEKGDFVTAIKLSHNLDFVTAALEIGKAVGVSLENHQQTSGQHSGGSRYTTRKSTREPDWERDYKLSGSDIKELVAWRGYSMEFCAWADANCLIGRHNGLWAFPVYDNGRIVSAHIRKDKNDWIYRPRLKDIGVQLGPLVIGDLASAEKVFSDESQWDLFSLLDRLGIQHGEAIAGIATRGVQNGSLIGGTPDQSRTLSHSTK